jgi:hypothetical protein
MAYIAHNYYSSLRLACQGRWAAVSKPFKIVAIPYSLLQHYILLYLTALYTPSIYLLSQSQLCLSSTGKRSISPSCTTLFCISLPLL